MQVLIIEDEKTIAQSLSNQLRTLQPEIEVVGIATSITESIAFIKQHDDLDIIFSDIRIDDGLSFNIFKEVTCDAMIVFTTAYDEYAIQAFDFNCVDYLLKPVTSKGLERALLKCEKHTNRIDLAIIQSLAEQVQKQGLSYRKRMLLENGRETVVTPVSAISHIVSENGISRAFLTNGQSGIVNYSLSELVGSLPPDRFFRINRKTIVNVDQIANITRGDGREATITLNVFNTAVRLPITPERRKELLLLINR